MIKQAYAIKRKSEPDIDRTSTVGIATYLAERYILEGFIVYGTVFTINHEVTFLRIMDVEKVDGLKGSKYCQSNLHHTFQDILDDLKEKRKVLFCGTPCQVSGLKNFLKVKNVSDENIIFIDLVCHGVASPKIFSKWLEYCEKENSSAVDTLMFRDKRYGWITQAWTIKYKNGREETETIRQQIFKNLYYGGYIIRPSCHECRFTNKNRLGDITLGDFWNISEVDNSFMNRSGVGLVFVNSENGEKCLEKCRRDYEIMKVDAALCSQPQLEYPAVPNRERNLFWKDFDTLPFSKIVKKYSGLSLKNRLIQNVKDLKRRR